MGTQGFVFLSQGIIFLLEALAYGLEGDISLDLAQLEELNASLELSELCLLAFAECTLCSTVRLTM